VLFILQLIIETMSSTA